jgi:hypothetical protein
MNLARIILISSLIAACYGCEDRPKPKVPAEQSKLKAATDVFWALDKMGYIISKEKPQKSRHGCKPSEYLAKKGEALFRISVFHCGDAAQAKTLVEHPKTRRVDDLLRNHGEGGILQRGPLEIIVRLTKGDKKAAAKLLEELGEL